VRKVNFGFPKAWEMKNHRISPDGKYLAFMTHSRPKAHFHWVNIANVTLKFGFNPMGEVDELGKPVTYSIITRTNILTGEKRITRTKEMNIWGLNVLAPVAITNQKAQSN
jgi:hypothetical protein